MAGCPRPLTIDDLWYFARFHAKGEERLPPLRESFSIATAIVAHFTSREWVAENVLRPRKPETAPLKVEFDLLRKPQQVMQFIDFGETLYNLQHVEGFPDLMERLRQGDLTDAVIAELDLGRVLRQNEITFRYIRPAPGATYDVEITMPDGTVVCGDAKCKLEATGFSAATVRHALHGAREQLPAERPGFVFVKMPQPWLGEPDFGALTEQVAREFLRGTGRVVSVKYFWSVFSVVENGGMLAWLYREFSNPRSRFGTGRNWDIFPRRRGTRQRFPDDWQFIDNFPDGVASRDSLIKTEVIRY